MPAFAVIGHTARTDAEFPLNDLPGGAGRMDIVCRCVTASLFLSHGIRHDVRCYLILLGPHAPPKTILIDGSSVRSLNPDERSSASLIRRALTLPSGSSFRQSGPGIFVRKGGLPEVLGSENFCLLEEGGSDIRTTATLPSAFLLSDHLNLTPDEEQMVAHLPRYSVGPRSLHADHAITTVLNEIDRREAGWT